MVICGKTNGACNRSLPVSDLILKLFAFSTVLLVVASLYAGQSNVQPK